MLVDSFKAVKFWAVFIILSLFCAFYILPVSYMSDYFLMLWGLSVGAALWRTKHMCATSFDGFLRGFVFFFGFFCIFMGVFGVSLGVGKAPFSLDDFSLILAGVSLCVFAFLNHAVSIPPMCIPPVVVFGYQFFGGKPSEWFQPLLQPTVDLLSFSLNVLGFEHTVNGNLISFLTVTDRMVRVSIVPDCTGIWSLIAYGVSVGTILLLLPKIKNKGFVWIFLGFPLTYFLNNVRLVLILGVSYYLGPSWIEPAHMNTGWIVFSIWMLVFWYIFFSLKLYEKKENP